MTLTYVIEIPDKDIEMIERQCNDISGGKVGYGEIIEDVMKEAVKKISVKGRILSTKVDK